MNKYLWLDFETRCKLDLSEVGLDNYARQAEVLMLGWAIDDGPVQIWLPPAPMPPELRAALLDPAVIKISWNAQFERVILKYSLSIHVPIQDWRDPMILARSLSMPGKLESVCDILKIAEDKAKLKDGARLIKLFCEPNGQAGQETLYGVSKGFNLPQEFPEDWQKFIEYCRRDVEIERLLFHKMEKLSFPEEQWVDWHRDQAMNEEGLPLNLERAKKALSLAERYKKDSKKWLNEMTGLENANSPVQLLPWLKVRGYKWGSINKTFVDPELNNPNSILTPEARAVLVLRRKSSQTSYTKIKQMVAQVSPDGRLRYQFMFMGAARTGRWASAGINVQNLPRPIKAIKKMDPAIVFDLLDREAYEEIMAKFENSTLPFVASIIRMLFESPDKKKMIVCDLSAIEHRVVGWIARCPAIMECHRLQHDPYIDFAPYLYPDKNYTYAGLKAEYDLYEQTKGAQGREDFRQEAKAPVLGGGFGLGGGELVINTAGDTVRTGLWGYALNVCGVDMSKDVAHKGVEAYRKLNIEVVQLWTDMEQAFKWVLKHGGQITVGRVSWDRQSREWIPLNGNFTGAAITFSRVQSNSVGTIIRMRLPSGRYLHYLNCRIEEEKYTYTDKKTGKKRTATGEVIYYDGVEHSQTEDEDGAIAKKTHKWGATKTYGGKLCLAGNTQILTNNGIKNLTNVSFCDRLWDGLEWVDHDGIIYKGEKETIEWKGLHATPNHGILAGREWHELQKVEAPYVGLISRWTGLVSVLRLYYSHCPEKQAEAVYSAIVEKFSKWVQGLCGGVTSIHAFPVLAKKDNTRDMGFTTSFKTTKFEHHGSIEEPESYPGVITPESNLIRVMAGGVLKCMNLGKKTLWIGSDTSLLYRDGMLRIWTWIESTMTEITNPEIFASFRDAKIQTIAALLFFLNTTARDFLVLNSTNDLLRNGGKILYTGISDVEELQNGVLTDIGKQKVYDLRNCGSRNRFTVITDDGPLVVHNCENAVQAVARDVLVNGVALAADMGFQIFGVFHDEIATLVDDTWDAPTLEDLRYCMSQPPAWGPTMLLDAAGYTGSYYRKG